MSIQFDITDEELPIFRAEADDQLQILEEGLVELERRSDSAELVQALFRAAHTLKGSAGMIGHKRMVDLTHALETVLDGVRKGNLTPDADMIDVMLASLDSLHLLLDEVSSGEASEVDIQPQVSRLLSLAGSSPAEKARPYEPKPAAVNEARETPPQSPDQNQPVMVIAKINSESIASAARAFQLVLALQEHGEILELEPGLSVIETAAPVSTLTALVQLMKPKANLCKALSLISEIDELMVGDEIIRDKGMDSPRELIRTHEQSGGKVPLGELLVQRGVITAQQLKVALENQQNASGPAIPLGQTLVSLGYLNQEVLDEILAEQTQIKKTQQTPAESEAGDKSKSKIVDKTVRTSVERLDNLMNLIGELITDRNRMYQLRRELEAQYRGSAQVEALSDTITHVGRITDMLQSEVMSIRMLPISNVFNKFPRLVRDLSRKAEKQVDLVMRGEDTELDRSVIEVISDPLIHLIRNAVDHGIETPAERVSAGKPERGVILLTARHEQGRIYITVEDNGRGIDIKRVKSKAVEKGQITQAEADSMTDDEAIDLIFLSGLSTAKVVSDVSGRGVGMDIVRANIERLNGNIQVETWEGKGTQFTIILPLTLAIVPTLLVRVANATYAVPLVTVSETLRVRTSDIQTVNAKPVITLRDHVLPVCRLTEVFNLPFSQNGHGQDGFEYIVVVRSGKSQIGLIVDDLIGEEEVVVKSLSSVIGDILGVSSAAILGDGQVALILDVQSLIKLISAAGERIPRGESVGT